MGQCESRPFLFTAPCGDTPWPAVTRPVTHSHFPAFTHSERGHKPFLQSLAGHGHCVCVDAKGEGGVCRAPAPAHSPSIPWMPLPPGALGASDVQSLLTGVCKHPWAACSAQPGSPRLRAPRSAGVDRSTATFPLGAGQSQRQPPASWAPASGPRPTHPDGPPATVTALCCFFQTSKWAG